MDKLSREQRDALKGLANGKMQLRVDPMRDELVRLGLVEMKLGGWGLTREGQRRAFLG